MTIQPNSVTPLKAEQMQECNHQFLYDVAYGLSSSPKRLQSKYFYDKKGDRLFQQIMALPEYYLTRCETEIFEHKTAQIAEAIKVDNSAFDLVELGAGDATKSLFLLKYLSEQKEKFSYMPIDISGNILEILNDKLHANLPELEVICLEGEYFEMLNKVAKLSSRRKVVLFLGSNIGNMEFNEAEVFCAELRKKLNKGDVVLVGFDLKKHPQTILDAYNDASKTTALFNLNLLERINNELDANFNLQQFEHYQNYDPLTGACKSYLISLADQKVSLADTEIKFDKNETIYMEISQKFSVSDIENLAINSGFMPIDTIMDDKKWFADAFWLAT
ncbi:L-histidine N(alpha)-methyltransferase [Flavobacterium sp. TMP13]|uniref:L-histidine N(alpha)-methyltransferase n=1 Tax=Flavobacterium sp. TMP13 TaxID=3425950 RepID=UPI003D77663F